MIIWKKLHIPKYAEKKDKKDKSFLEQNGLNPSKESIMQDIGSSEEYIVKNRF